MAGVVGSVGLAASGFAGVVVAAGVPKVLVVLVPVVVVAGVDPNPNVLEEPEPKPKVPDVPLELPNPKPVPVVVAVVDGAVVAVVPVPVVVAVPVVLVAGVDVAGVVVAVPVVVGLLVSVLGVVPKLNVDPVAGVVVAAGFVSVVGADEVVEPNVNVLEPDVGGLSPQVVLGPPNVNELPNVVPAGLSVNGADVAGLVPGEVFGSDVLVPVAGLVASVAPKEPNENVLDVPVAGFVSPGFLSPPVGPPNENVFAPRDDNEPKPNDEDPLVLELVEGAAVAAGLLASDVVVLGAPNPNELVPGLVESAVPKLNDPEVPNGFAWSAGFGDTFAAPLGGTAPGRGPVVST